MVKKRILILFLLFNINIFCSNMKVLIPDGLPALSIVNMISTTKEIEKVEIEYKLEKISDALVVDMLKREGDIAIVPSSFSAQLYNKNLGYKILGTVGWGSLYVVSREDISSLEELKNREIYTFGKGLTPDIIFQSLLRQKGIDKNEIKINYLSNGNELATMYLGKKVDTIVISEPMLSKILAKEPDSNIVVNLNDEWKGFARLDLGYPQATLVIKEEIYDSNPKLVEIFINRLTESIFLLYNDKEKSVKNIKANKLGVDTDILADILTRANIFYTPIKESLEEYDRYFEVLENTNKKVIGGKQPNEKIYAK